MERFQVAAPVRRTRDTYVAIIGTDSSFSIHSVKRDGTVEGHVMRQGRWCPTKMWCGSFAVGDGKPTFKKHVFQCQDFDHVELQVATLAAEAGALSKLATPLKRGPDSLYHCPLCDHKPFAYGLCFAQHLWWGHGHLPLAMMVVHTPPPNNAKRKRQEPAKA